MESKKWGGGKWRSGTERGLLASAGRRYPLYAPDSDWTSSNDKPVAWAI